MVRKSLVAIAAMAVMVAFSVVPADAARAKKEKRPRANTATSTSLDGRNTGRTRTCWNETLVYDGLGVPVGPYCH
jgi:hypothetical protein